MKQKLLKIAIALVLSVTTFLTVDAQKTMDVSNFVKLENDLMARVTKPVRDNDEGKLCALIRVVTDLTDLVARADALGIVRQEQHDGELWLYVPYGAKSISFSHQGYYPLMFQYGIDILEGTVYELRLNSGSVDAINQQSNTQLFVLTVNPEDAKVYVDDMEVSAEYGVFAAMMNKGEHSYKVVADQYEAKEGFVSLDNQPVRETAQLSPLFGTFQLRSLPEDNFEVFVNGKRVGKTPYNSERLEPGRYNIHIEKKDFVDVDTLILIRENDNIQLVLESEDWHVYNNLLGGRAISFGLNVGYIMPFVTSNSGGGYTGSLVNYSLGDSRENVNYGSQSGFSVGLAADIRLYKNLYLLAGVNFTHIKYNNKFKEIITNDVVNVYDSSADVGDRINSFKEKYTIGMIEIPLLASYRFVIGKNNSLHFNVGPYITYGLSSKMDFSGSTDASGNIYHRNLNGEIDYSNIEGVFTQNYHLNGDFDLFSSSFSYNRTSENAQGLGGESAVNYSFSESPYNKFNYGLKFGTTYEIRGFQIGVCFNLQLSNMANKGFWESSRVPAFTKLGTNNMSGYSHKIHYLEIKLGYVFRY